MRTLALIAAASLLVATTAHADSGDRFDPGTTGLQFGAGVLGGGIGGAALGGAFYGLAAMSEKGNSYAPLIIGGLGIVVGALAGTLISVKLVGGARDADGAWGGASLGLVGGFLAAGAVQYVSDRDPSPVTIGISVALLVAGPVIGYQASNDGPDTTAERRVMISLPVAAF